MSKSKITYAEAVAEIEQILQRLRQEQSCIDSLESDVKRATELIALCREKLYDVESKVKAQLER